MFDIGFSEIVVCCVVALIVIGPERMPEAVRTVGLWIGRFKRSLRETRVEIERQMGVDDIRRQLHNEDIMRSLENTRTEINQAIEDVKTPLVYNFEPELPYHAHMDEVPQEQSPIKTQRKSTQTTSETPTTKSVAKKTVKPTLPAKTKTTKTTTTPSAAKKATSRAPKKSS